MPWVTFTDPELAHVGLTEEHAQDRTTGDVNVLRWPYHENDRAQAERATEGIVKVVTDTRKARSSAPRIVGQHAGELIQMWSLADLAGPQDQGHDRMDLALSDAFGDQQARRIRYYASAPSKPPGAQGYFVGWPSSG